MQYYVAMDTKIKQNNQWLNEKLTYFFLKN